MYLGVDIGTSGVKAVVLGEDDRIVAQASSPLTVQRPHPLWSEQDPGAWRLALTQAVRALPAEVRGRIQALGLSGQMHGAVLLDEADRPLRPAILWNDGRSEAECRALEASEPRSRAITGNPAMPGFTAPKLQWVRRHEPQVFAATRKVLLPKDYIRLTLVGEAVGEMSDAAGTLWLDVGARAWSEPMLAATGLTPAHMPRLVEGSEPSGVLTPAAADELGLPRVVVAGGGGDNAASAVGVGVIDPGQAFLSLGTSGVLFLATDRFRPNPDKAVHAFCHCLPDRWHQMAVLLSAASAVDRAAAMAGYTDVMTAVQAAQDAGLRPDTPLFLPYLSGERTPHNDPFARGVLFGLGAETGPADLVAAALEGVAHAFADGLDALLDGGGEIGDITMTGGGSRLHWWGDLLAAALGRPLTYRTGGEIGAAFGAARLGRLALTGEAPADVCRPMPVERVVEPDARLADLMRERREAFRSLYPRLRPSFREFAR